MTVDDVFGIRGSDDDCEDDDDSELEMARFVRSVVAAAASSASRAVVGGGEEEEGEETKVPDAKQMEAKIREMLQESSPGLLDSGGAIEALSRPSEIPGKVADALRTSKMLNGEDDDDDGGFVRLMTAVIRPIMYVILWLRSSFVKPLLLIVPEWIILLYLVWRNVAVATIAVRAKRAMSVGKVFNDDWAFANMYSASAVVFGVLSVVLFALLADRSVSTSVIASVLSCAGVGASCLLDRLLRSADTPAFAADEGTIEATERRLMFLHGGAGLAFAAVTMAIPACCPYNV
ncbi:MAG: hypothetical protein B7Z66_15125 [Chromatiales bacterium 21-64-14]|nr:MAG: hypothetical protein B7Z66_15125 [Chromatiales bacterium 21-64-14]